MRNATKKNNMKSFKNVFGQVIEYKPFFQNSLNVWRVARFEDNEIDVVFENKGFKNYQECLKECFKKCNN